MSTLKVEITDRIRLGAKKDDDGGSGSGSASYGSVYMGLWEKFENHVRPGMEHLEGLTVHLDRKNTIVAVSHGDQKLRFSVVRVDDESARSLLDVYRRRLAGVIVSIKGERPRH